MLSKLCYQNLQTSEEKTATSIKRKCTQIQQSLRFNVVGDMVTTSDDISNTLENSEVNSDVTDTDSAKIYVHTDEKTQIPPDGYIKV
jgi:hypothetical protein